MSSHISKMHPCPDCKMSVANIAAICQYCGSKQPNVDIDGYETYVQLQTRRDMAGESKGKAPRRLVALGALAVCLIFTGLIVFVQTQVLAH